MLVNDPDPAKFHAAMSNECVDKNFPVYGLLLRWTHIKSAPAIRAVSFASTLIALMAIYYLLRGSFNRLESAVGVLTVWSTPLIIYHSFQARFYEPWFASLICFAAALRWGMTSRHKWVPQACIAITAFFACTLHTLGLPAIVLIAAAEVVFNRQPIRSKLLTLLPALTGPIAVVLFIPLLREQLHSFCHRNLARWQSDSAALLDLCRFVAGPSVRRACSGDVGIRLAWERWTRGSVNSPDPSGSHQPGFPAL